MHTGTTTAALDFWQRFLSKFVFVIVNSDWAMSYFHKLDRFECIKTQKAHTQNTFTGTQKQKTHSNIFATSLNSPHTIVCMCVRLMVAAKLPKNQLTRLSVSPLIFESLTQTYTKISIKKRRVTRG